MKAQPILFLILAFFFGCNDPEIDDRLLDPRVRTVKEFIDNLKENKRFYSLTLIYGYNPDQKTANDFYFDSLFNKAYTYAGMYGLESIDKWRVETVTLRSECSDYVMEIRDVYVPYKNVEAGEQPAFIRIGFDLKKGDDEILDVEIVNKESPQIFHRISQKQSEILNCE